MKKTFIAVFTAFFLAMSVQLHADALTWQASNFKAVTTTSTAKLTWNKFPSSTTSIKVSAQLGSTKTIKTLKGNATTVTFSDLLSNRSYVFGITAFKKSVASKTVTLRTNTKKIRYYNSIFFGQPDDMVIGDPDQDLFALPNGGVTTFRTSTPTICSIVNETTLHAIKIGDCVVIASNAGDDDYLPAADETRYLTVSAPIGSLDKTLLWSDEFNGSSLNSADWTPTRGDGCGTAAGCGWGNGEAEAYADCALKADGGILYISATTPVGDPNCKTNKTWTSGKFTSFGKRDFTYGYFESRMKMPAGGGAWPAFWLLGSNINTVPWPNCGEIDIMEYTGNATNKTTSALHYANSSGVHDYKSGAYINNTELPNDYHTYGLLWLPNELTFVFDGKQVLKITKADTGLTRWPFGPNAQGVAPKMYLIFNLAMGGNYGGGIEAGLTKAQLAIDYVRYYKVDTYGATN